MIGALAAHADCVASIEQTHFLGTLLLYLKGRNAQPPQKSTAVPFLEKISTESVREYQLQVSHSMMYCVCGHAVQLQYCNSGPECTCTRLLAHTQTHVRVDCIGRY